MKLLVHYLSVSLLCFTSMSCTSQQKPDNDFDVSVSNPAYTSNKPLVMFDEAHHNIHTSTGTYRPFVKLITNDGYTVVPNRKPFTKESLSTINVLVISNAKGGKDLKKYLPAFTEIECEIVSEWVKEGGSLLLVADHHPMGMAAENLSQKFGVHMFSDSGTSDSVYFEGAADFKDKLVFSRDNKLLLENEITNGSNLQEYLTRIVSDRGQSLSTPPDADVILKLSDYSYHAIPDSIWDIASNTYTRFAEPVSSKGNCQGLALKHGNGRVVILGEAAMITAQKFKGEKFGMNTPGNDNMQFALNIMHWLSRKI